MAISNKNSKISDSMRETHARHKYMSCKVFKFKVDKRRLTPDQKEWLKMVFVEAKWLYNYVLANDIIYSCDPCKLKTITHKDKDKNDIEVALKYVSASVKQKIVDTIKSSIKGLATHKKKGDKVGKLKFKTEYNGIDFKQYGGTHDIRGNRIKLQGCKKPIKVFGLKQLQEYSVIDYCNAKLVWNGYDWFIYLTCFVPKKDESLNQYKNEVIGLDLGIASTLTLSNGEKIDISVEESEWLKKLQRKFVLQTRHSNNWYKTLARIKKEYAHISNKNDVANKIVHKILSENATVIMQDEQLNVWKSDDTLSDNAKAKMQHSILGRIKSRLGRSNRVIILDKYLPTSKHCFECDNDNENLKLSDRRFVCSYCGYNEDRNIHAANNMIKFYLSGITKYKDWAGLVRTSKRASKHEDTTSLVLY